MIHKLTIDGNLELISEQGLSSLQIKIIFGERNHYTLISEEDLDQLINWLYEHRTRTLKIKHTK